LQEGTTCLLYDIETFRIRYGLIALVIKVTTKQIPFIIQRNFSLSAEFTKFTKFVAIVEKIYETSQEIHLTIPMSRNNGFVTLFHCEWRQCPLSQLFEMVQSISWLVVS
jgi:hypothetical protein